MHGYFQIPCPYVALCPPQGSPSPVFACGYEVLQEMAQAVAAASEDANQAATAALENNVCIFPSSLFNCYDNLPLDLLFVALM